MKLFQHGISRTDIEDRTTFYGWSSSSVLHAVLSGTQTVGILPACELEKLENRGKVGITHDLSIFSPQRDDTLSCTHSTITYPSITVGVLRTLDPAWKRLSARCFMPRLASATAGSGRFRPSTVRFTICFTN